MEAGQLVFDPIEYLTSPRWQTMSLGLERTHALLSGLGDPQRQLRFVHVAGTNGKGSTCAFVASVLEQAGYRVGLFTSPAVYSFEERIRVNGQPISYDELTSVTEAVKQVAETLEEHPTEFELLTGVAFTHFVRSRCDVVVVEVGMGGRLDSTNVIEAPEVAVITPVSFDHCAFLGDTLAEIAGEKAGIIKPGAPVVCARRKRLKLRRSFAKSRTSMHARSCKSIFLWSREARSASPIGADAILRLECAVYSSWKTPQLLSTRSMCSSSAAGRSPKRRFAKVCAWRIGQGASRR